MSKAKLISPNPGELPSHYSDRLGVQYSTNVSQEHKKINGQFFTPIEIAKLMGSFASPLSGDLRILDPGSGTGILGLSLIEALIRNKKKISSIHLTAFETDLHLIPYTKESFRYAKKWLKEKEIEFSFEIIANDYILTCVNKLKESNRNGQNYSQYYDFIISNPPYFKLQKEDIRVKNSKGIISGQTNIYSLFMALSAKLLNEKGQLIFIVPRSFTSGSYFKEFREFLFENIFVQQFHLFNSRRDTFSRDNVLQETIILKGTNRKSCESETVIVSSSQGLKDIDSPARKSYSEHQLINFSSDEKILHLPINDAEELIVELFKNWSGTLNKYNIQVSTGPVVAFRSMDFIKEKFTNGTTKIAPLFWLHNIQKMNLEWPLHRPNKGQYIRINDNSQSILLPNKNYIFLRRFSSKDDKSRLIAAPYFSNYLKSEFIGVENKVNYIYRPNGNLARNEVVGLCALLNSELFDNYFRIFNGNVNVSATELREMTLPPIELIKEVGNRIILGNDYSFEKANQMINEELSLLEINE